MNLTGLNDRQYSPEIRAVEILQKYSRLLATIDIIAAAVLIFVPFEQDWILFCISVFLLLCYSCVHFNTTFHWSILYKNKNGSEVLRRFHTIAQAIEEADNSYFHGDGVRILTTWRIGIVIGELSSIVLLITAIVAMIEFPIGDLSEWPLEWLKEIFNSLANIFGIHLIVGGLCQFGLSFLSLKILREWWRQELVVQNEIERERQNQNEEFTRDLRIPILQDDGRRIASEHESDALQGLFWFGGMWIIVGVVFILVNICVISHVKSISTSIRILGLFMIITGAITLVIKGHFLGGKLQAVTDCLSKIPVAISFTLFLNFVVLDVNAYSMVVFGVLQIICSLKQDKK